MASRAKADILRGAQINDAKLFSTHFWILKDNKSQKIGRHLVRGIARLKFSCFLHNGKTRNYELCLPILALWIDGNNSNPIKVYFSCNTTEVVDADLALIKDYMRRSGAIEFNGLELSMNRSGTLMRYGKQSGTYMSKGDNWGESVPVYESKALAIKAVLNRVQESGLPIGGTDIINFSAVPDDLMAQMGWEQVAEEIDSGLPMWRGDPGSIVKFGQSNQRFSSGPITKGMKEKQMGKLLDIVEEALTFTAGEFAAEGIK